MSTTLNIISRERKGARMILRFVMVILMLSMGFRSLNAFDTYWHFSAAAEIGHEYGFSEDAVKVLKLSSFCMDYFGPFITEVVGFVAKNASYLELQDLPTTGETHSASNFMHFDDLAGALDRNWKFDYLWSHLLRNARRTIGSFYKNDSLPPDDKKRLILISLGITLHMVEDFYSHSDWVHFDFAQRGFAPKKTAEGFDRAPTWFEVRNKLGAPVAGGRKENWGFRICCGLFPPVDSAPKTSFGVPLSHTAMNHDNSQLFYDDSSQIKYHNLGRFPAHDSASAAIHQSFAYHTACAAGVEWITLLQADPTVKKAIQFAKDWDVSKLDNIKDDLEDGLSSAMMISCLMKKWDGSHPSEDRNEPCGFFKILAHIHVPTMGNIFWGSFPKDSLLQKLTKGYSDTTGHYVFN
ncbi:MAG: hypothetical protein ABI778_02395 [Ignavibacteriota bacterium]